MRIDTCAWMDSPVRGARSAAPPCVGRPAVSRLAPLVLAVLALAAPRAVAAPADSSRVAELDRKIEVLARELEDLRMGAAAGGTTYEARHGLAPAAAKVYGIPGGISVGGYGEMLFEAFDAEREDGARSGMLPQLDLLRAILYVGYKFNDEVLFNSEIEIEHAGTGEEPLEGEVSVEFAYIDWSRDPRLGVRAGMVLAPIGLVNEMHEPPVFIGARRPDVESAIIPTTWRVNGAGIYGEFASGVSYRAYLTEGLDARGFTASRPIRGGRQKGSESRATKPALSVRVDYADPRGFTVGAAAYRGDSWQDHQPDSLRLSPVTTLVEAHATFERRGLQARALFVRGTLDDAGALSDALGLTGSARLGESFNGFYVEGAYDVLPHLAPGSLYSLAPYARWEMLDTQENVAGGAANPANEQSAITFGLAFRPHANVVLKGERQQRSNDARTAASRWNVQLGWLF